LRTKLYYFIIYKPYGVLSQYTDSEHHPGLGSVFKIPKHVYPVGRLDHDSEGLLILTNDRKLNEKLLHPTNRHQRTYWVEMDGQIQEKALNELRSGVLLNNKGIHYTTLPAEASRLKNVPLPTREPDINRQKHLITSWLELKISEGKNRQVRKMTAAVGHPTLRLVRVAIEDLQLLPLGPGEITQVSPGVIKKKLHLIQGE
jgi:23S rRNA pseudouridine2457 synthase